MTKEQLVALGLTEDLATKAAEASQEELKSYIPKHRFDEVNEAKKQLDKDLKERDTQIDNLKKTAGNNEEIKKQIETLQTENKKKDDEYQATLKDLKLSNAIKLAVAGKVHDEDLVASLFDKSKLILSDDGKVTGLDDQIKTLGETKEFLFKETQDPGSQQKPPAGFRVGGDGSGSGGDPNQKPASLHDAVSAHFNQTK